MRNGHPVNPGHNWTILATGDFNGDRKTDILWRTNQAAGAVRIWTMDDADVLSTSAATLGGNPVNLGSNLRYEPTARQSPSTFAA